MKPSLHDWHIYGGACLVALGASLAVPWTGLCVLGTILLGLGLMAPPRRGPDG